MENDIMALNDTTQETQNIDIPEATPQAEDTKDTNITVRFNHEDRVLTRDEAVQFAQKGLKLDKLQPLIDELSYLAALRGKTPIETVKEYIALDETVYKNELIAQYGEDTKAIDALMEKYKQDNALKRAQFVNEEKEKAEKKEFSEKIAEEFILLKGECPEIDSLDKIPISVLKEAKQENLLNAYLRYKNRQMQKVALNNKTLKANKSASAGALSSGGEHFDTLLMAFLKGLNN
ncbi:MAG: hypothetical protein E7365_07495 [Clostridiales bacterium]|nr:hypothetical protein [Clostridiales bacterium]